MRIKTDYPLHLSEVARILKTDFTIDTKINAISTDSRNCEKNDLFFAICGENFDGADFINEAKAKGAYTVSNRNNSDFTVENAENALLSVASEYKKIIAPKYTIAVTGSVGKTTVKDFVNFLLSAVMKTHKTEGNFNNTIGLSYTLLSAKTGTEALVCELGMNHRGEIDLLSRAINPDISIITNIGTAHIGNLGSREEIARAKLEIENGMSGGKTIIKKDERLLLNTQNPYYISYSDRSADLFINLIETNPNGSSFSVKTKSFEKKFETKLYSQHTIDSLAFAIAVCDIIGIEVNNIDLAIKNISHKILRQKFINSNGYTFYDDAYNSSPEAVIADFDMLARLGNNNSAILGDMLELGEHSEALHRYIGTECAKHGFKKLYAFGKYASFIAEGATGGGMKKENVFINTDLKSPEITALSVKNSYNSETLLVKASHSVNASRIIELLTKGEDK